MADTQSPDSLAKRQMSEREFAYKQLFHLMHESAIVMDNDGRIIDANPAAAEMLGYPGPEAMIGTLARDCYIDPSQHDALLAQLRKDGHIKNAEVCLARQDSDDQVVVLCNITLQRDEDGHHVRALAIGTDITDRMQSRVLLEQQVTERTARLEEANRNLEREAAERAVIEAALREGERNLQALLNANQEDIFLMDRKGTVLAANEALARHFERRPADLIGTNAYSYLPPHLAENRRNIGEQVIQTREPVRFVDRHGDRHLENFVYPMLDAGGEVGQMAIFSVDITNRVNTEAALNRLNERLQVFHDLDRAILRARSPEEITQVALLHIQELIPCQRASVGLFDSQMQGFSTVAVHTKDGVEVGSGRHVMLDLFAGHFQGLRKGQPYRVDDIDAMEIRSPLVEALHDDGIHSFVNLPMIAQKKLIGTLNLGAEQANAFSPEDLTIAQDVAASLAVAVHNAQLMAALQASEERYRSLVEISPNSVIVTDLDLNILIANQQAATSHGYEEAVVLVGTDALSLVMLQDRDRLLKMRTAARENGLVKNIEFELIRRDGSHFPAELSISLVSDAEGNPFAYLMIGRDITEQKQAAEELENRAHEMGALYKTSLEVIAELDLPTRLAAIVQRAATLLGTKMGGLWLTDPEGEHLEIVASHNLPGGSSLTQLAFGEGLVGRVAETGEPLMVANYDQWQGSAPGYMIPIGRILGVPLTYGARILGAITVYDVDIVGEFSTEEVNLLRLFAALASVAVYNATLYEEVRASRGRLQDLSRRLVEVQEAERRYLARELHDEIGQVLTGLNLMLGSIEQSPAESQELLDEAQKLLGELSDQVSDLSLNLRPTMLDDLGLLPALVWHLGRFENQTSIEVNFEHTGLDRRFDLEVETAAYRIVQEGLTNVARHAGVDQVEVRLWTDPHRLFIQIEDQGTGFNTDQVWSSHTASGLAGMQERAEALGGTLEINSTLGAGTTLLTTLPIVSHNGGEAS